jgi:hypothetical protein
VQIRPPGLTELPASSPAIMPTGKLRSALLLALPLFAGTAACKTGLVSEQGDHWTVDSVPRRMVKQFTGYRSDFHGEFVDYQYQKKKHISRTLRRHIANNSPENPFEAYDESLTSRRHPHSLSPDPLYYMHAESVFIGLGLLGITGSFIPIPVDSLVATMDGNWDEFWRGFTDGGDIEAQVPPDVSDFRVKNR